jgi:quinol monooxygenase YgiN
MVQRWSGQLPHNPTILESIVLQRARAATIVAETPAGIDRVPRVAGTTRWRIRVTIKAISTFTVQPGRRDEFVRLFESLVSQHLPNLRAAGCSGTTLYTVADEPDTAVEIADWESADARDAMMQSEAMAAFAPLFELVVAPPTATVVNSLH